MKIDIKMTVIENAIREIYFALADYSVSTIWKERTELELWTELVACILGSRVKFEVAFAAVERLSDPIRLIADREVAASFDQLESEIVAALSCAGARNAEESSSHRYPFAFSKGGQIRKAVEQLFGMGPSLRAILEETPDVRRVRRRLAADISGLGPKQASLFLRNIGYGDGIAILDTHLLTYLKWIGKIETPAYSVSTIKKYEVVEEAFIEHSYSHGYMPDRLDLAVWVVMRVVKEEL